MIYIISSAKSLNSDMIHNDIKSSDYSYFVDDFLYIKKFLASLNVQEIKTSMKISDNLALLNYNRFQSFNTNDKKQALFLYHGDVYKNLDPSSLNSEEINFLQNKLRIISALYGMVKPLDKIFTYRLEMSTNFRKYDLKLNEFWSNKVTSKINCELSSHKEKILLNLASREYSSVINQNILSYPMINIEFRQKIYSQIKNIGIYSKKARGHMLKFIAQHHIDRLDQLKRFSELGYSMDTSLSDDYNMYFVKSIS